MLPYGILGEGMLWQAATDMYFRMAEGYVTFAPPVPEEHSRWPIVAGLYQLRGVPAAGDQFKAYLANHDVGAVIVGPRRQYRVGSIDGRRTATTWLRVADARARARRDFRDARLAGRAADRGRGRHALSADAASARALSQADRARDGAARRAGAIRSAAARSRALSRRAAATSRRLPRSMRSNSVCCRMDGSAERFPAPSIPIRSFTPTLCSAPPSATE